jgi:asparagine synthase (glutamine-hydrolysing)
MNEVAEFLWNKPSNGSCAELGFNPSYANVDMEKAKVAFNHLFTESVFCSLDTNALIGACLSGGLDSSSIVCTASNLGRKLITFSCVPEQANIGELSYINEVVNKYGLVNYTVTPTFEEFFRDFGDLVAIQENPFLGPSIYMQYRTFKLASEYGIKVLLDGQGGDESLGGYTKYIVDYLLDLLRDRRFAKGFAEFFRTMDLTKPYFTQYLRLKLGLTKNEFNKILKCKTPANQSVPYRGLAEHMHYDMFAGSLVSVCKTGNANAKAFGLKIKYPFMYPPLVEYLFSLPNTAKIRSGWTKYLLREAMKGTLPEKVRLRRSKFGFPAPELEWATRLIEEKMDWCSETVKNVDEYIDFDGFRNLCRQITRKKRHEDIRLFWRILIFSRWMKDRARNLT